MNVKAQHLRAVVYVLLAAVVIGSLWWTNQNQSSITDLRNVERDGCERDNLFRAQVNLKMIGIHEFLATSGVRNDRRLAALVQPFPFVNCQEVIK